MSSKIYNPSKKRATFLKALASGDSVTNACNAAGIGRRTAYDWRGDDEDFAAEWSDAVETGTDVLEDVAIRRAIDGSDTLLIFMLKARRPEKFKDRQSHEHSGPGGGPIEARAMDLKDLPTDVLHDLKELAARVSDGDPPPASD